MLAARACATTSWRPRSWSSWTCDPDLYAQNPDAKYSYVTEDREQALRDVVGYRLYVDLRRGWRVTSPNLEQCGLLRIRYRGLDG